MSSSSRKTLAALAAMKSRVESERPRSIADENPPVGERGEFLPVGVMLPASMLLAIKSEGLRRKRLGLPNRTTSAIIREAVAEHLAKRS